MPVSKGNADLLRDFFFVQVVEIVGACENELRSYEETSSMVGYFRVCC